jgi:hypothetical protein
MPAFQILKSIPMDPFDPGLVGDLLHVRPRLGVHVLGLDEVQPNGVPVGLEPGGALDGRMLRLQQRGVPRGELA